MKIAYFHDFLPLFPSHFYRKDLSSNQQAFWIVALATLQASQGRGRLPAYPVDVATVSL